MTTLAAVVQAGLATIQDGGRRGHEHVGVPRSGALHRARYLVATALLSGEPDGRLPAIEILAGAVTVQSAVGIAVGVVGPAEVTVDGLSAATGSVFVAAAGSHIRVTHAGPGPCYLVVEGWAAARVLGSASFDSFSGLGGGPLVVGQVLEGRSGAVSRVGAFHRSLSEPTGPIRVVARPEAGSTDLSGGSWTVIGAARSGVRLRRGPDAMASESIPSMPVVPGSIQLTPDAEAIVLGPDGGLTGGYPVIGVVASADRDRISLLAPGDDVSFAGVSVAEAYSAHESWRTSVRRAVAHPRQLS